MTHNLLLAGKLSMHKGDFLREHLTTDWNIDACAPEDSDRFAALAAKADAMIAGHIPAPWPAMPRLKLFQIPFTGFDFLKPETLPRGAIACNTFEHETSIAEYILAALLDWEIGLSRTAADFARNSWNGRGPASSPVHGEIRGKTFGIVGHGHIGREVALRARAFQARAIGIGGRPRETPPELNWYGTPEKLDALCAEADYVVVCAPLNDMTRSMIGPAQFAAMKPSAIVVNVGRGPVVDEDALYEALSTRRIRGAVIDVWYQYPSEEDPSPWPSKHPLQELDNITMTPHNSGWTQEQIDRRWVFVAANLDRLARGETPLNKVMDGAG